MVVRIYVSVYGGRAMPVPVIEYLDCKNIQLIPGVDFTLIRHTGKPVCHLPPREGIFSV
jgi:hypothetical protein